ncbi:hypothetical protein Agub_g4356 [Astrephomene gubernaculifera]|uniref:Serine protease n=1 Tax=Astrephomene gubernaculifera TaxID=47775 RepID=A0AAD3DNX3_9CHLO|nr:hypothetical protein Agub_g4356 [Astrephomene gubernaculifera]
MAAATPRSGSYPAPVVLALLLFLCRLAGADNSTAQETAYSCRDGCPKTFEPVCGADGQTYGNPCLATCQGVKFIDHNPCPGEPILHHTNAHIVAGSEEGSPILTPHHIHAFRHEGYRYTGQMTFSSEMSAKMPHNNNGRNQQATTQQQAARAVRITRDGHVYVANMDESVQKVIDALISSQAGGNDQGASGSQQALLNNLRQWREYRPAAASGRGNGKWAKHASLSNVRPGEHTLQPELDGASGATQARPQATTATTTTTTATSKPSSSSSSSGGGSSTSARGQQQGPSAGKQSWGLGRWRRQARQVGAEAAAAPVEHRQARRSLGIFDTDDRVDCPRTPTYPFTAMGQINVRDKTGNYVCSGTLVGPDVVLTAAHCVFNRNAQAFYDNLDFAPGRYRTLDGQVVNPFGVVPWNYVTVYQSYSTASTPDPNTVDIAVIKLSQRVGTTAGWMGVLEPCTASAPSRYVALTAGYPSDQLAGTCLTTQCVVVQDPCTDGYLYHKCDTASGQSGSPMYMMAMTAAHKMGPFVRAVHNIEWVQELPNGSTVSYINSAVSITPDHYRSILAWIAPSFNTTSSSTDLSTPMGPASPPKAS